MTDGRPRHHKTADEIIREHKAVEAGKLAQAEAEAKASREPLATILLEMGAITREALLGLLKEEWQAEPVDLSGMKIDAGVVRLLPMAAARRHIAVPFAREGSELSVAMADPADWFAVEDIQLLTALTVRPFLALPPDILACLDAVYGAPRRDSFEIKYALPDAPRRHMLVLTGGALEFCDSQEAARARIDELGREGVREVWEMRKRTIVPRGQVNPS